MNRFRFMVINSSVIAVGMLGGLASVAMGETTHTWTNGSGNNEWSQGYVDRGPIGPSPEDDLSNWDVASPPDAAGTEVLLPGANGMTIVDGSFTVGTLQLDAGALLRFVTNSSLTIAGDSIVNNATIELNDVGGGLATLTIANDVTLSGSGQVIFQSGDDNRILSATADDLLTISTLQELTTSAAAIANASASRLGAAVNNQGTITANEGGLRLDEYDKTNNNLIQAINGGNIQLSGFTLTNQGIVRAGADSTVDLDGATIIGGTIDGPGLVTVTASDATLDGTTGLTIASDTTIELGTNDALTLIGEVTNNGVIRINDLGGGLADLIINGDVTLNGTGQVVFQSNDDNRILSQSDEHVLTIGAEQELITSAAAIAGGSASRIATMMDNLGTITADEGGLRLDQLDKTNNNLIQAINGGNIQLSGFTLTNQGIVRAGTDSTVDLDGATIIGGTIDGPGLVTVTASDATLDGTTGLTIASDTTIELGTNDALTLIGEVTNNGVIRINDLGGGSADVMISGDVTLNGTGQVLFQSNDDNRILSQSDEHVLTIGADQELITSATALAGASSSRIATMVDNLGTITADTGGLRLDQLDKTNNNLIQAINGGNIQLSGFTLTNPGIVRAGTDSTVDLDGATIIGGMIDGAGLVTVTASDATLDGTPGLTIAAETTVDLGTNDTLTLKGTVTNHGIVQVRDAGGGFAVLQIDGHVTLDGTGSVLLDTNDDNYISSANAEDVLTIGSNQSIIATEATIVGQSQLRAALVNQGLLEVRGGLTLNQNDKTNQGTIRASGDGDILADASTTITNFVGGTLTGGRWEVIDDGTGASSINLNRPEDITTIAAGTSVLVSGPNATFAQLAPQTVDGTLAIHDGQRLDVEADLDVNGKLEFGLSELDTNGPDFTTLGSDGTVTFGSDSQIDVVLVEVANEEGGSDPYDPAQGEQFNIVIAGDIVDDGVDISLPTLTGGKSLVASLVSLGEGEALKLSVVGAFVLGDMDGNAVVDAFDVAPFELALVDRLAYYNAFPALDPDARGDMDDNGVLDAFDVAGFETALAGGAAVPEPATGTGLLILAGGALARRRKQR